MPKKIKYTPPPWYHDEYYITNYPIGDTSGPSRKGARCIACAPSGPSGNEFKPADADIMTAAPKMYEALKDLYNAIRLMDQEEMPAEIDGSLIDEAGKAIAEAEGDK